MEVSDDHGFWVVLSPCMVIIQILHFIGLFGVKGNSVRELGIISFSMLFSPNGILGLQIVNLCADYSFASV